MSNQIDIVTNKLKIHLNNKTFPDEPVLIGYKELLN